MEVNRTSRNVPVQTEPKRNVSAKKDFSQSFNMAKEKNSEEELKKMLDDIKKKGNRLVITKSYVDVKAYKNLIKEYLSSVLSYMYKVKKDISFWQTQYFITVDVVDKKLEELSTILINEEKANLSIAATVDEIRGLLIDIKK